MLKHSKRFQTLDELRCFVAETLASFESLKADQCPLTQQILYRSGKPCATQFCLQGPRAVCLTAIWDMDNNRVLFYGSGGQRMSRIELVKSPRLG
jgi:hypothetical protein